MNHRVTGGRVRWRAWPQTATIGVALLTAACGGAAAASSTLTSSASASATASPSGSGQATAGQAAYVQCMRAHGVPKFGTPPSGPYVSAPPFDSNSPTFKAAKKTCASLAPANEHFTNGDNGE